MTEQLHEPPPPGEVGRELTGDEVTAARRDLLPRLTLPSEAGAYICTGDVAWEGAPDHQRVIVRFSVAKSTYQQITLRLTEAGATALWTRLGEALGK